MELDDSDSDDFCFGLVTQLVNCGRLPDVCRFGSFSSFSDVSPFSTGGAVVNGDFIFASVALILKLGSDASCIAPLDWLAVTLGALEDDCSLAWLAFRGSFPKVIGVGGPLGRLSSSIV